MQSKQVKEKILALIADKIGIYKQGNIPAIWIGNVEFGQIAEGLEVNIPSFPEFVMRGNQIVSERWSIRLTQFPSDGVEKIFDAMRILQVGLIPHPNITFIDRPNPNDSNDANNLPFLPTAVLRWEIVEVY